MKASFTLLLGAAALVTFGAFGQAQIERLTLSQMVQRTDDGVQGRIVEREVFRVDHPVDGPELYYTSLLVQGESLKTGEEAQVVVTFPGGWIDRENGVDNSEAPTADETTIGREVVVFHKWTDNMGGDVSGNALYASHGGLYTTFLNRRGDLVVQGRGPGYAIERNVSYATLKNQVAAILEAK